MQGLTAEPRGAWSTDEVRALLTAPDPAVRGGCDLLDSGNRFARDISDDVAGGTVEWDADREVHRTCRLSLLAEFNWTWDRFRPWVELSSTLVRGGEAARFYLGVFTLTSPDDQRGEDPQTWEVSGSDLIQPLQTTGPGDTHVATAGTTYLDAIRAILTASGVGGALLLDGSGQAAALPATRVWCLSDSTQPTWLSIANDLLAEINYEPLYASEGGTYRSRPHKPLADRGPEWEFTTADLATDILAPDRTIRTEGYNPTNHWRFVNRTHGVTEAVPNGVTPTEANGGVYVVDEYDPAAHPLEVVRTEYLDAVDAAALAVAGDRIVTADKERRRLVSLSVDPLPIAGHRDVVTYVDGTSEKLLVARWAVDLTGARTSWTLGGSPPATAERSESQSKATVTSASPLRVVTDGAATDSPANALDAATYTVDQRVTVTVRNPLPPLIQGEET